MARSYQVSCPPGSKATIADMVTIAGGSTVTILNSHATEPLYIGGDENEIGTANTLSTSTGLRIAAGQSITVSINGNEVIWGRGGTSTVTCIAHVFRANKG
jgi:hypothetical protein